jgi:DMSO/TMAO reductase YedYZ molybdopterin-dependent catalytic subunit
MRSKVLIVFGVLVVLIAAGGYSMNYLSSPALATVTDTSKLTSPFFKKSQNGDKKLIYQTNQVAIIYRPKIDRIIVVGPVSIDTSPSATSSKR